jgi:hypothetical protein
MVEFDSFSNLNILIIHWGKMLFVSIIVYLVFSVFIYPYFFERFSLSKFLIIFFVWTYSINILTAEILGLFQLLSNPWMFLGIQIVICALLPLVIQKYLPKSINNLKSVFITKFDKLSILEIIPLTIISVTFLGLYIVGISTPINNNDSLATHLPRIYYWLQHGSLDYWTSINLVQLVYPINAHIQGLWLFLLGKSEYLFFIVQWFSLIIISATIFEISKELGFSKVEALISTLFGLSLPVVTLQVFSYQGDLTVSALMMASIFFLLIYYRKKHIKSLYASIFCVILAIGTKQTSYFTLPVFSLVILCLLIIDKRLLSFIKKSWLIVFFALMFAFYQNIQNLINITSFFGIGADLSGQYSSIGQIQRKATYVIPRYYYQLVGVDSLPRSIQPSIIEIKKGIFKAILDPIGIDLEKEVFLQIGFDNNESFHYNTQPVLSEDTAWFGPLAFLFFPIAIILSLFKKNKLHRNYAIITFLFFVTYFLLIFLQRPGWDPYQGRYFILGLCPMIPLVSILIPKQRILRVVVYTVVISCSIVLIFNTLLQNDTKPIITAKSKNNFIHQTIDPLQESTPFQVFIKKVLYKITYPTGFESLRRNIYSQKYYDQLFYSNNISAKDIEFINSIIPEEEPISVMVANNPLEYALFGINRSRSLYSITDINDARQGYYIVSNSIGISPSHEMELLDVNGNFSIYYIGSK